MLGLREALLTDDRLNLSVLFLDGFHSAEIREVARAELEAQVEERVFGLAGFDGEFGNG
jgi:hypothetical protein